MEDIAKRDSTFVVSRFAIYGFFNVCYMPFHHGLYSCVRYCRTFAAENLTKSLTKMKKAILFVLLLVASLSGYAQRFMDRLDRSLVATVAQSGSGNFVSWRILGEEYYDVTYNLYANGSVVAKNLKTSNYVHAAGNATTQYQVAAVVRGVEGEKCEAVKRWSLSSEYGGVHTGYLKVAGAPAKGRGGEDLKYEFNDCCVADVTGDGRMEIIAKRMVLDHDPLDQTNKTCFQRIECYTLEGELLWYIDMGPNMMSGPDSQWDCVAYDWDMDGRAEIMLRGADNMIIGHPDGTTTEIGDMSVDTRNTILYNANMTYTNTGAEYLLYLEGATGKPYACGPHGEKWIDYPCPRVTADEWGDGYGHRSTKHYFGAPYLDGKHPSMFVGRGCYTQHKFAALDVDPATHKLSQRWYWECRVEGPWFGNGFHNFAIADVDMDGRDEIMFGSMTIDDNGLGLSTSGLGHGDAQHCGDLDPYRWGLEQFTCLEHQPANNYRSATTSQLYYRQKGTGDDGRALAGNFYNQYPGSEGQSSQSTAISLVADKQIPNVWVGDLNFRIYWDGDLCDEVLNSPGIMRQPKIDKPGVGRLFLGWGAMNNGSKNHPCMTGDILGDWREELLLRDGSDLFIYTSNYPTTYRITTLLHDHQYRGAMLWEGIGYNQPPHPSFFLGDLEGITTCPPALTTTGRTVLANGSTIGSDMNGQQVLVFDNDDIAVSVAEGAEPWVALFNVPSWVQGTAESNTTVKETPINYTYYTCNVTGAGFSGATRLVKQGEGELTLPTVAQTHTGGTDIWNGTLSFNGEMLKSSLWLNRHTTLKSDGGHFANIKADYNATIYPGQPDHVGTLTADVLLLGFGSRVVFDIDTNGQADQLNTMSLTIDTRDWEYGPKYLTPVFEFKTSEVQPGIYCLGQMKNLVGSLDDVNIEGLGTHHKAELLQKDGQLWLEITLLREPTDIVWSGQNNNVWDVARTENFLLQSAEGQTETQYFATGDNVIFNGSDAQKTVYLKGQLEPSSVTIDADNDYTFKGNGALVGNTRLVKRGKGKLTIKTDNTFTGGTLISGGTIAVDVLSNENMRKGGLGIMDSTATGFTLENGGTLQTTIDVTLDTPIRVESQEGGIVRNDLGFMMNNTVSGTRFVKTGSGIMTLAKNNLQLDTLVVRQGVLVNDWVSRPAKVVVMEGGQINDGPGTSYPIIVPAGKKAQWNLANRATFTNKILGEGELTIHGVVEYGNGWAATRTPIAINLREFRGTIVADADEGDGRFTFSTSNGMPDGTLNIKSYVTVLNEGKTMRIGKLTGTGKLGGFCGFSNSATAVAPTWQIGNGGNWSWAGKITDLTHIEKVGSGKVSLTGKENDYTGNTTVKEGELHISGGVSLGTGKLTVAKDAIFSGITGANFSLTNSQTVVNGTLQVGVTATITSGVMDMGNKPVTFNKGSFLVLGIAKPATASNTGGASLQNMSRITMNGTVRLNVKEGVDWQVGDSIVLWNAKYCLGTPILENIAIDEGRGLYWDTTDLKKGILRVTNVIPSSIEILSPNTEEDAGNSHYYDLQGHLMLESSSQSEARRRLPTGIYVVRQGKKTFKVKF